MTDEPVFQPDASWFELTDVRKRLYSKAVWIPVYGGKHYIKHLKYPAIGYSEDHLVVGSAVIYNDMREAAEKLDWSSWVQDGTAPYLSSKGEYFTAGSFTGWSDKELGFRLVLGQHINSAHARTVMLHPDFSLGYGLIQEGEKWMRPEDGYAEVARAERDDTGEIRLIEIRSEYLRDFLAARGGALRLYYYRERRSVFQDDPGFFKNERIDLVAEEHYRCEVRSHAVNDSGDRPGTSWIALRAWRTDVDPEADVPEFVGEEATASETRTGTRSDENIRHTIWGELWRAEWIEASPVVARFADREPDQNFYVTIDGSGSKVDLKELNDEDIGKYLWFKPQVIRALLDRRGSSISWYSRETGNISAGPSLGVHFGMNRIGLINVYAYDIARRPFWEREIWVAHNSAPDGGVSAELQRVQMATEFSDTHAPEVLLFKSVDWLGAVFEEKFGATLFRAHDQISILQKDINRFRATDENGLRELAKNIVRSTIERLDKKALLRANQDAEQTLGSIKLLETLLSKFTSQEYARERMAPIFGVYDLRLADAHLGSSSVESAYSRLGVSRDKAPVLQAMEMLEAVSEAFGVTGTELKRYA